MNNAKNLTIILFLLIFNLANCATLISRMAWGPSVEIQFIEKPPFEIPPLQKTQPTKDFSFHYKVGEFGEEIESITYGDIKENSGRTKGKRNLIFKNKILDLKANGDYLLSRSWVGKEKSNCENPNVDESWYDKNSNFLENIRMRNNCTAANYSNLKTSYKLDNLLLDISYIQEKGKNNDYEKVEARFLGITNYNSREAYVLLLNVDRREVYSNSNRDYVFIIKMNELIYIDRKHKVPLVRKIYAASYEEEPETTFSFYHFIYTLNWNVRVQEIRIYTYPTDYLE